MSGFTYSELFAGVGGFSAGLQPLGGTCIYGCEIEAQAREMHALNFQPNRFEKNIRQTETLATHDILTGGFPCQPFSRGGTQPGFNTSKGTLFHEIVRLLELSQPSSFLLENVTGLLHLPGATPGELPHVILNALELAGYTVLFKVIDSRCLLPQIRNRCYLVGFLDAKAAAAFRWPIFPELHRNVGGDDGILMKVQDIKDVVSSTFQLTEAQWTARLERCSDPSMWLVAAERPFGTLTRNYRSTPGRKAAANHIQRREAKKRKMNSNSSSNSSNSSSSSSSINSSSSATSTSTTSTSTTSTSTTSNNQTKQYLVQSKSQYATWEEYRELKEQSRRKTVQKTDKCRHDAQIRGWNNLISPQLDWDVRLNDIYLSRNYSNGNESILQEQQRIQDERDHMITGKIRPRFFSHRESSRLMGFPHNFEILREKQASGPATALFGNAVCPPIVGAIAACVLRALKIDILLESLEETYGKWDDIGTKAGLKLTLNSLEGTHRRVLQEKMILMSEL